MRIKVLGNVIHNGHELVIGSEFDINDQAGQSLIDCKMAERINIEKPVEDDMPKPIEVEEIKEEVKPKRKRKSKK